jgi:hypothetical protein
MDPRFLDIGTSWSGQIHAPTALTPGEEATVPIGYEAGWAPEPIHMSSRGEKLFLSGLELQALGRPARSQSLYRLSYPG